MPLDEAPNSTNFGGWASPCNDFWETTSAKGTHLALRWTKIATWRFATSVWHEASAMMRCGCAAVPSLKSHIHTGSVIAIGPFARMIPPWRTMWSPDGIVLQRLCLRWALWNVASIHSASHPPEDQSAKQLAGSAPGIGVHQIHRRVVSRVRLRGIRKVLTNTSTKKQGCLGLGALLGKERSTSSWKHHFYDRNLCQLHPLRVDWPKTYLHRKGPSGLARFLEWLFLSLTWACSVDARIIWTKLRGFWSC